MKILTKAEAEKSIASIKTRGNKLQADIHQTAVSVLSHAAEHGDVTLINRLMLALPASARRNALASWFIKHGKLAANMDKASRADVPLVYDRDSTNGWQVEAAIALPYWEMKAAESGSRELDISKALDNVYSRLITLAKSASPVEQEIINAMLKAAGKPAVVVVPAEPAMM